VFCAHVRIPDRTGGLADADLQRSPIGYQCRRVASNRIEGLDRASGTLAADQRLVNVDQPASNDSRLNPLAEFRGLGILGVQYSDSASRRQTQRWGRKYLG